MESLLEQYKPAKPEEGELIPLQKFLLPDDVEEKVASGEFPTPKWLQRQQQKFGRVLSRPSSATQQLSNSQPPPQPSSRTKQQLLQHEQFQELDAYVRQLKPQPQQDWASMASILFAKCANDLQRVRAAFYFVACVDTDAAVAAAGDEAKSAVKDGPFEMICRMRILKLQDEVFAEIMKVTSIPTKMLTGRKKCGMSAIGSIVSNIYNRWFACFVAGEWRFVDAYWGSVSVQGSSDGQYRKIDETTGEVSKAVRTRGFINYECDERFFLTDATDLILTHSPTDGQQWQLLVRPLTDLEFSMMVNVDNEREKNFQLDVVNCPFNVVITDITGLARLKFKELTSTKFEYKTEMSLHVSSYSDETADAIKQQATSDSTERLTRISRDGSNISVVVTPPSVGQYKLELYGLLVKDEGLIIRTTIMPLYTFVLHCPKANPRQLPQMESQLQEIGIGAKADAAGVGGDTGGEIAADEGEAAVKLHHTQSTELQVEVRAADANCEIDAAKQVLQYPDEGGSYIRFLATSSGQYLLIVRSAQGQALCQFLIEADAEFIDGGDGQLPDIQQVGGIGRTVALKGQPWDSLQPVTHLEPYLRLNDFDVEVCWSFSKGAFDNFSCELVSSDSSAVLDDFTFVNVEAERVTFHVRLPRAGNFLLRLYATPAGQQQRQQFFNYLIRSIGVQQLQQQAFPSAAADWLQAGLQLVQPMQRLIAPQQDGNATFRVTSASADQLRHLQIVTASGASLELKVKPDKAGSSVAEAVIPNDFAAAGESVVIARVEEDGTSSSLLTFQVECEEDRKKQEEEKSRLEVEAQKRLERDRRRQRKQENYNREKAGLPLLHPDPIAEEEERKTKEEEERMRMEKEESKRKEEEEKKQREEEERTRKKKKEEIEKKEEEERIRREAEEKQRDIEEKMRRNEEKRVRAEEEEQKKLDEEDRIRKEEEKRKIIEEEVKQKREEEKRIIKEEEEKKKLEEEKETKRKKEEDERRRQAEEENRKRKERKSQLELALQQRKMNALKKAVADVKSHDDAAFDKYIPHLIDMADAILLVFKYKSDLKTERRKAEKSHNIKKLQQLIAYIDAMQLSAEQLADIEPELSLSRDLINKELRFRRRFVYKLNADAKSLQELRSYPSPDPIVQNAVTAMLLLQGFYEKRVRRWTRCQPLLKDVKSLSEIDVRSIHPEIAARANELMLNIDERVLKQTSAAAFAFYEWAKKCIASVQSLSEDSAKAKPANLKLQRQLLKVSQEEEDDYDWEDGKVKPKRQPKKK